jgi:hypothetical protein
VASLPRDISFEQWIEFIFGNDDSGVDSDESYGGDWWNEEQNPTLAVAHLTRLLLNPEILLERYTHHTINGRLGNLARNTQSNYTTYLVRSTVPWADRKRGLLAIGTLYERLFARLCTSHFGHLGRGPEPPDPLNGICYMWWCIFPHHGRLGGEVLQETIPPDERRQERRQLRRARRADRAEVEASLAEARLRSVDDVILHVMERTLRLESEPCREGVLHGLGRWRLEYPERTRAIIDRWLAERPAISPELYAYAWSARDGRIL